MEAGGYPRSLEEIGPWRKANGATVEEARRRFVQFVVLEAIAGSPPLARRLAFKGGNALRYLHGNPRSTIDLDFTADGDLVDDDVEIRRVLDAALRAMWARTRARARCQRVRRNPPGLDKVFPTYEITVCYQLPGDRFYRTSTTARRSPRLWRSRSA